MRINFEHLDEAIMLEKGNCNVLVVDSNVIYSKIIYSLFYKEDEYFKVYDESFKTLPDKKILFILNPLQFDFDERNVKTTIFNHILSRINIDQDFKQSIQTEYQQFIKNIVCYLQDNEDIDFAYREEVDIKEVFKVMGLSVDQGNVTNVFEKLQLILEVLNEFFGDTFIIFTNLNMLLTQEEYQFMVEQINMNSQTILIIERNSENLEEIPHYYFDSDFYLSKT